MDKQKRALFIGIGIIALFAVLLVGAQCFDRWTERKADNDAVQPIPVVTEVEEPEIVPLVVSESAAEWKKVCINKTGEYQVSYPNEWSAKIGDAMNGHQIIKNCDVSKLLAGKTNTIRFSSITPKEVEKKASGIWITAIPKANRRDFKEVYRESEVDGEKMIWISSHFGEFYHKAIRYEVEIHEDVSESLADQFLSTFKFLN